MKDKAMRLALCSGLGVLLLASGAVAQPWPVGTGGGGGGTVEITDGVNGTVGVAPASTAPTAAQPALVVGISPQGGDTQVVNAITSSAITGYATAANQIVSFTAAAPTVSASGSVTSLVLKASATTATGGVKYFHAENSATTGGYCILYNGTSAPGTGALTAGNVLAFQLLPASGFCDWTATNIPIAASTGAVVLVSSAVTPFTYTTGTITAAIYGLAQ